MTPWLMACPGDDSPPPVADTGTSTGETTGGPPATTNSSVSATDGEATSATTDPDGTSTGGGDTTGATTTGAATDSGTTSGTEGTGTTGGSESESGSTGMEVMDDTIYDVQDGTIGSGVDVDIQGVVVTGVSGSGFFAQEPAGGQYSGVYVYIDAVPMVSVGDEVDIIGTTEEFNDLTEINAVMGSVTPTGMTGLNLTPEVVPAADLTAMTGEPWEGVLVRIEGAPLTVVDLPGFDEFDVNDGGADDTRVDNFLYNVFDNAPVFPNFGVGASFTAIQGPLNFTFGEFKVAPREELDLEGYMEPPAVGFGDCGGGAMCGVMGEQCFGDMAMTVNICTFVGCAVDADCPDPDPALGGTADILCQDLNGDMVAEECSLDCSAGQTCPTGMDCFAGFICVWPA